MRAQEYELIFQQILWQIQEVNPKVFTEIQHKMNYNLSQHVATANEKLGYLSYTKDVALKFTKSQEIVSAQTLVNDNIYHTLVAQEARIQLLETQIQGLLSTQELGLEEMQIIEEFIDYICLSSNVNEEQILLSQGKLPIAIFTPLTPLENGIADYAEDVIIELSKYFTVDVYIDDGYMPTNDRLLQVSQIYHCEEFVSRANDYSVVIYQIGNNPHHVYMVDYLLRYPGIVVLHEFILDYLNRLLPVEIRDRENPKCLYDANLMIDRRRPYNKFILDKALGILVHSDFTKGKVLEQNITSYVKRIEIYAKEEVMGFSNVALKEKYNLTNSFVFASFGFVTSSKRIESVLESFSMLVKEYPYINMRYLIVGKVEEQLDCVLQEKVRLLNLSERVRFIGFTELATFSEYIEVSDVCINLRNPYGGESSGSLARIFSKGKPCIINSVGAFAEFPDNICIKIPNDFSQEILLLHNAMEILLKDTTHRVNMGAEAGRYAKSKLSIQQTGLGYRKMISSVIGGAQKKRAREKWHIIVQSAKFLSFNRFTNRLQALEYVAQKLHHIGILE